MLLNAHAGAKYGIPFPVFVRASFGTRGANIPAILRALVACGWFGIQSWIGGQAIHAMLVVIWPGVEATPWSVWACFLGFWALNMVVVWRGVESNPFPPGIFGAVHARSCRFCCCFSRCTRPAASAPCLPRPAISIPPAAFLRFFFPSLTAMVGYWATLSLNIPDFTRYAKSSTRKSSARPLDLPVAMTLYSFIGIAVTSASAVIFGHADLEPDRF